MKEGGHCIRQPYIQVSMSQPDSDRHYTASYKAHWPPGTKHVEQLFHLVILLGHHLPRRAHTLNMTMQAYFIRNKDYPNGVQQLVRSSTPLVSLSPIKPPRYADAARASLACLKSVIFVTHFECEQNCRSFGICSHYQFACGVRHCPDGLICDKCSGAAPEKV